VLKHGFGTYRMEREECRQATRTAFEASHRHIETGIVYENEAVIGEVTEGSTLDQNDVFPTTKVNGYPEMLTYDGGFRDIRMSQDSEVGTSTARRADRPTQDRPSPSGSTGARPRSEMSTGSRPSETGTRPSEPSETT